MCLGWDVPATGSRLSTMAQRKWGVNTRSYICSSASRSLRRSRVVAGNRHTRWIPHQARHCLSVARSQRALQLGGERTLKPYAGLSWIMREPRADGIVAIVIAAAVQAMTLVIDIARRAR